MPLTQEDCQKLYEQGMMTEDEMKECYFEGQPAAMQVLNSALQAHMGFDHDAYRNNALTVNGITGRDPPVPNVEGTGVEQVPSRNTISGRDAQSRMMAGITSRMQGTPLSSIPFIMLGLVGVYSLAVK
jgi:hypothetical protein